MTGPLGSVDVALPAGVDDPRHPSGGNRYDRQVCDGLRALGWVVRERRVSGRWPHPDRQARRSFADALREADPPGPLLIDGLLASGAPDLVAAAAPLRPVVVLVHLPFGRLDPGLRDGENRMLATVAGVVTTSDWTRRYLVAHAGLDPARLRVVPPGADRAPLTVPRAGGGRLLCAAPLTRAKGHDVLAGALAELATSHPAGWSCRCAGARDVDPEFAGLLRRRTSRAPHRALVQWAGPLDRGAMEDAYAATDLVVLPSRAETWGLVVTEALARGIPVLATDVGGIGEALGRAPDGTRPGLLVPAGDPRSLAAALRRWMDDASLRAHLRRAAAARRETLQGWDRTARRMAAVLADVADPDRLASVGRAAGARA